jgi:hypothetical protein
VIVETKGRLDKYLYDEGIEAYRIARYHKAQFPCYIHFDFQEWEGYLMTLEEYMEYLETCMEEARKFMDDYREALARSQE